MSIPSSANTILSGLSLQERRLEVSANNVANMLTDGFQASRVVGQETEGGGVSALIESAGKPELPWFPDGRSLPSNTDLVIETATQVTAVSAYRAQVSAFKTIDEAQQSLMTLQFAQATQARAQDQATAASPGETDLRV